MENKQQSDTDQRNLRLLKMVEEIEDFAILTLDSHGNIENWNKGAEKIKGYQAAEISGQNFSIFYTKEDREAGRHLKLLEQARLTGKATDQGWRIRKDGSKFWSNVVITATHNDDGEVIGFSKITQDITARMLAEKTIRKNNLELETKNKELEQFVYIASHDLQEPLLTIHNFIELIEEEYGELFDNNAQLYLNYMKQASVRMRGLIKGLLEYSRIGRKKTLSEINVEQLIGSVCQELQTEINAANASINYPDMPIIMGYEAEFKQLLYNLISNSVKFRRKDVAPVIYIAARLYRDGWMFAITDNGIGIDAQYVDKVFLIFQRLNNRDDYEGNGIGLANCKKIAELHNGTIWLESEPDSGTTFYFTTQV